MTIAREPASGAEADVRRGIELLRRLRELNPSALERRLRELAELLEGFGGRAKGKR